MESIQVLKITQILEKAAPSLNECRYADILSDAEVSKIIQTRQDYEYKLLSTNKELDIYLKYIQFELNLLLLISTRRRRKSITRVYRFYEMLSHTQSIFRRALGKWKSNIRLWKSFIDFSVQYQYQVESIFELAVKRNPTNPDIWILCAKWHAEFNNNTQSARNILQRGIKLIKESRTLWYEFFKLELMMSLAEAKKINEDEEFDEQTNAQYDYEIPTMILNEVQTLKALKDDADLRFDLLNLLCDYPKTQHLQNILLDDLSKNFRQDESVIYRCVIFGHVKYGHSQESTLEALCQVARSISTPLMYEHCAQFAKDCFNNANSNNKKSCFDQLINVYVQAHSCSCMTINMILDHLNILHVCNDKSYQKVLDDTFNQHPHDLKLAMLQLENSKDKKATLKQIIKMRQDAPRKEAAEFWTNALQRLGDEADILDYKKAVIDGCDENVKIAFFNHAAKHSDDIKALNENVEFLLTYPPNSVALYKTIIKHYSKDWKENFEKLNQLYRRAIGEHGVNNEDFWIGHIMLMKRKGDLNKVHHLYTQATKTLAKLDGFIEKYDLIK
ncbi:U3 small nucleolar RNA-associated protein [Acrasis kona]|uniref:U3 small nucleolar RNA-associated protein n=1 Tax=Acrasis kona TaxID=1008807 RepID=A0AAW2Z7L0_9EUKA